MLRFVAGNDIKMAIKKSAFIIKNNKSPILNYIIEDNKNKFKVYQEYLKINEQIDHNYKIAIKLSSFNFDYELITDLISKYKNDNIKVLIDAENSENNKIYNQLTNKLINNFNYDNINVIKTYQMYRKDSFDNLNNDIDYFKSKNINLGVKLVRGAYWNIEKNNNELFTNKNDTDFHYNKSIIELHYKDIYTILATHNKESINLGVLLNNSSLKKNNKFEFAHLLDMNTIKYDEIKDFNKVNVYIPYGPYKEMIPYLFRRLYENIDSIKYIFR